MESLELFDGRELRAVCDRGGTLRGRKVLRGLLASEYAAPPTREELEHRFAELVRDHSLPPPEVNVMLGGYEVDALWREARLVVELDGGEFHATRAARERDYLRDERLKVAGYEVLRLTWRRVTEEPAAVASSLLTLIETRLGATEPSP